VLAVETRGGVNPPSPRGSFSCAGGAEKGDELLRGFTRKEDASAPAGGGEGAHAVGTTAVAAAAIVAAASTSTTANAAASAGRLAPSIGLTSGVLASSSFSKDEALLQLEGGASVVVRCRLRASAVRKPTC